MNLRMKHFLMLVLCGCFLLSTADFVSLHGQEEVADKAGEEAADLLDESPNSIAEQLAAEQPDWVQQGDQALDDGTVMLVIESDPYFDAFGGEKLVRLAMEQRVSKTIDDWIQPGAGELLGYDWEYINQNLRVMEKTEYVAFDTPVNLADEKYQQMHVTYTQLRLDEKFRHETQANWEELETRSRLKQTGLIGGGVLVTLLLLFGFTRIDTASRGYYSHRLFLLTLMVALVAGSVWWYLSGQFMWL